MGRCGMVSVTEGKPVNLALQGGGSHGAFTWGVLEYLLNEPRIHIEAISGTSAGAMNAAVLAHGYIEGGRQGAQKALEHFWREVSSKGAFSPFHQTPVDRVLAGWNLNLSPTYNFMELLSRVLSPYQMNPLGLNPLKDVLESVIDFEALQACAVIKIFVTATSVKTGKPRVFSCEEITADALLASACIPFMFKAVEVEGEHYWDGGYVANPALWPFYHACKSDDVVVVQINPVERSEVPSTAGEIINRLNEVTFNSSLISQMRALHFVGKLMEEQKLDSSQYKKVLVHIIEAQAEMEDLNASSKLNVDWEFFQHLREIGHQVTEDWLKKHYKSIGNRSSVDIEDVFF